jgi:hypothetical protein
MSESRIPGIIAKHAVIQDVCRDAHGDTGAFHKAAFALLAEYDAIMRQRAVEKGVDYHLALTVHDTKRDKPRGGHVASMPEPPQGRVIREGHNPEPTPVKDSSERARRPTEILKKPLGKGACRDGTCPGVRIPPGFTGEVDGNVAALGVTGVVGTSSPPDDTKPSGPKDSEV